MSNPYGYNEQYMHSQRDPLWGDTHLGRSSATMAGFGCYVTVCAFLCSKVLGRDVTPGELVMWLNNNGGFDARGRLIWDAIRRFTRGKLWLSSTWNPIGRRFTAQLVNYTGTTHMVCELGSKPGQPAIVYDPFGLPAMRDPFVKPRSYFPPRVLGKFYFKTA